MYPGFRPPSAAAAKRKRNAIIAVSALVAMLLLVFALLAGQSQFSTSSRRVSPALDAAKPTTRDHWHSPFSLNVCGVEQRALENVNGPSGIHTHGDGIIHVEPSDAKNAGKNATLGLFLLDVGVELSPTSVTLPAGQKIETCNGRPARVRVYRWQLDQPEGPPELFGSAFESIHFDHNHDAYTISLSADEAPPPLPSSIVYLNNMNDPPRYPRVPTTATTLRRPGTSLPRTLEGLALDVRGAPNIGVAQDTGTHLGAPEIAAMLTDPGAAEAVNNSGFKDSYHLSWTRPQGGGVWELTLLEFGDDAGVNTFMRVVADAKALGSLVDEPMGPVAGYRKEGPDSVRQTILWPTSRYLVVVMATTPNDAPAGAKTKGVDAVIALATLQQKALLCKLGNAPQSC